MFEKNAGPAVLSFGGVKGRPELCCTLRLRSAVLQQAMQSAQSSTSTDENRLLHTVKNSCESREYQSHGAVGGMKATRIKEVWEPPGF